MNPSSAPGGSLDPFTKFWSDMMEMMPPGMTAKPSVPSPEDIARQLRQAFFDSWAKYCEDFMRSDAFLESMRKSMDQALTLKQQMNDFFTKTLRDSQLPTQEDTDSILLAVRRMEDRVLDRLSALNRRIDALEVQSSGPSAPVPSGKVRPPGESK